MKTIKKSIEINAPKEKVWDVLLNDKYTRIWYAEFQEGAHAETDWKTGSKAVFSDGSGNGMIGHIAENKPHELISIEYDGFLQDGREDYNSDAARAVKGTHEIYRLSGHDGHTHLDIALDMDDSYFEKMSVAWDKALEKIEQLAEAK